MQRTHPEDVARVQEFIDRDVVRLVHREVLRHGASLRLELAPTLLPVLGDRVQLQQVIINLVLNALQAMTSVTDRRRVVLIGSQRRDDGRVVVAVADTGVGIEAKSMDKLFNAFFTTKPSGMGMGLSICRSTIRGRAQRFSSFCRRARRDSDCPLRLALLLRSRVLQRGQARAKPLLWLHCAPAFCSLRTLNALTDLLKPLRMSSPTASTSASASTSACTFASTRIWPLSA
jgi:hypothetical protein